MPRAAALPTDVHTLQQRLRAAEALIETLKLQISRLQRARFGRSSEQLDAQIAQLELSLEELQASSAAAAVPQDCADKPASRPTRKALPEHLPREPHIHQPDCGTCICPECGGALSALGEDSSEMLEFVPEHWKVVKHIRPKYSCRKCQKVVQANAPSRPIPYSYAGPGLLAHILVGKFCDHLPFYRQSEIYARDEVHIERSTLAQWGGAGCALLEPLTQALGHYVLSGYKLHADDTPIRVLAPGTGKTRTGRLWAYVRDDRPSGSTDPPAVWFRYSPDRKAQRPRSHLEPFRGILQADAYGGFNGLYERAKDPLLEAACWAHARRKFFDVHANEGSVLAREALERIGALYAIEEQIRGKLPQERLRIRRERTVPLLDELHNWLHATLRREASKKSSLAGAIRYTLTLWRALTRFCEDGRIEADNNAAERELRVVALGRKNFLFAGSDAGGERAAAFYSLIGTAKLCGLDPEAYLRYVFEHLADHPINKIHELLPWCLAARLADMRRVA
jgi:transposase